MIGKGHQGEITDTRQGRTKARRPPVAGDDSMTAAAAHSGFVVKCSTNVTSLAGQTKDSAEVEIGFSGAVASDRTIKMDFACH